MAASDFHEDLNQLIMSLAAAASNIVMYPTNHPMVLASVAETHAQLEGMLSLKRRITFALLKDQLVSEDRPVIFSGAYGDNFIAILTKRRLDRITFLAGLTLSEFERFVMAFALADAYLLHSTDHIKIGKVKPKDGDKKGDGEEDEATVLDIDASDPDLMLRQMYGKVQDDGSIDMEIVGKTVLAVLENIYRGGSPLSMLATLKSSDEYTFTHTVNVSILSMCLAESLGFSGVQLQTIGTAAVLHDVGKVLIPEGILSKKGALTADERAIMETHAIQGARYLMKVSDIPKLTVLVALEHHIKYDGTGYPRIRGRWKPNIVSQMIAVADVFDALRTRRPYREPMPPEEVERTLLQNSGTYFNPFLLERFLELTKQ